MKKNQNLIIAVIIILFLGAFLILIRGDEDTWLCKDGQWIKHGNPSTPKPLGLCGGAVNNNQNQANNNTNNTNINNGNQAEPNITVSSPTSGAELSLPIMVKGQARVFESQVSFRIKDKDGNLIYQGFANAQSPDVGQFGPFEKEIKSLTKMPTDPNVVLEVYWALPKDGSDLDLISVPLKLDLKNLTKIKAFFNNDKLDPENSCNKVFPVEMAVAKSQSPARDALELLLQGISLESDYFTSINPDVKIQKLAIKNGVAAVDFDEQLQTAVGGSCRVAAIRAQITETLKQFSTVKSVIISINGRTEDILQP